MSATREIFVKVPEDDYAQLKELAEAEHRSLSDLVRLALKEYAASKSVHVGLVVQRGGDQRQKTDDKM